jgi:hypothetical protein
MISALGRVSGLAAGSGSGKDGLFSGNLDRRWNRS